jgi:hypothetical protein
VVVVIPLIPADVAVVPAVAAAAVWVIDIMVSLPVLSLPFKMLYIVWLVYPCCPDVPML